MLPLPQLKLSFIFTALCFTPNSTQVTEFNTGVLFVLLPTRSVRLGNRIQHWCALRAPPDSIRSLR
ncbi:hypothetical protein T08_3894 [Trichinella sp. T8]|nr:hypothetical protein T08_3894 [Trichinella sp. T8]